MTKSLLPKQDAMKRAAAMRAVEEIEEGMVVGLGSGSTAKFAIEALAARVANGLHIVCIPTSTKAEGLARRLNMPLTDFALHRRIDVTIDGADQVEQGTLSLVKGLGGALLREKIVASVSDRLIIVIDDTKLVDHLSGDTVIPVEVVPFGWEIVRDRLVAIGCMPQLRLAGGHPFITDGGHYTIDCSVAEIPDPAALDARLSSIVGIVESGLFIGLASEIVVGRPNGVEVIER